MQYQVLQNKTLWAHQDANSPYRVDVILQRSITGAPWKQTISKAHPHHSRQGNGSTGGTRHGPVKEEGGDRPTLTQPKLWQEGDRARASHTSLGMPNSCIGGESKPG